MGVRERGGLESWRVEEFYRENRYDRAMLGYCCLVAGSWLLMLSCGLLVLKSYSQKTSIVRFG